MKSERFFGVSTEVAAADRRDEFNFAPLEKSLLLRMKREGYRSIKPLQYHYFMDCFMGEGGHERIVDLVIVKTVGEPLLEENE